MLFHNLQRSPAALSSSVSLNKRLRLLIVVVSNENKIKLIRARKEKQSVTARCVSVKICDSLGMSELNFPRSELRKLEEGGESFCSCTGLDTSLLRAPMKEIVLCCLLCLTSRETVPVRIGYIPTAWKLATLCMLLKPDKLPSLTTSNRPISLMSSIMKLLERVIEQRLCYYLEDIGFRNKYQSGFRQNKSTADRLFRLSQSVMKSFNRRDHAVAAFFDVEKAFDNVWHNGHRYKFSRLTFPPK